MLLASVGEMVSPGLIEVLRGVGIGALWLAVRQEWGAVASVAEEIAVIEEQLAAALT